MSVYEIRPFYKLDWRLPEACKSLASPNNGNQSQPNKPDDKQQPSNEQENIPKNISGYEFQKLSGLIARVNRFHMKSEVSIQDALDKVYLLEEWVHNNHLRMRSRGLGKAAKFDFDFIIYEDSKEQFDLSKPFQCSRNRMPENALKIVMSPPNDQNNLVEV